MKNDNLFFRSLIKSLGIYSFFGIFSQLIPFLLLPIITHYLSPADYGVLAMLNVTIALAIIFIGLNTDAAVGREFFERDKIDFPSYITNCLYISLICCVTMLPVIFFWGTYLTPVTGLPLELLCIVPFIALARYIIQLRLVTWQSAIRPLPYTVVQLGQIITEIGLAIIFITYLKKGLVGRIDSILISSILFSIISLILLRNEQYLKWKFNKKYIQSALIFGLPMIPHTIGGIAISMMDRTLLINMTNSEQVGLYFIGFQIGNVLNMMMLTFNRAWSPWLFNRLAENNPVTNQKIVRLSYSFFALILIALAFLCLINPYIFKYVIGPEFAAGQKVVSWVALGSAFHGMYYIVTAYITFARKTHILAWITFLLALVNLVASYYFIDKNGYIGAAQGTAFSYFLAFILTWILAAKVYPMPWFSKLKP